MARTFEDGKIIPRFHINDVVQFGETHKWVGCFGIIEEIKNCGDDVRYLVGVPIPGEQTSTAYIFAMESECGFYYIGRAELSTVRDEEDD